MMTRFIDEPWEWAWESAPREPDTAAEREIVNRMGQHGYELIAVIQGTDGRRLKFGRPVPHGA